MGTLDPSIIGLVFLYLVAFATFISVCLGAIAAWKKINEPKPISEQYVTRSEVDRFYSTLKDSIKELESYVQVRFHEFADKLAPLPIQLAIVVKQYEKLESKIDGIIIRQEHMIMGAREMHLENKVQQARTQNGSQPDDVHSENHLRTET